MKIEALAKRRDSIFLRILGIMFLAGVLINIIVVFSFKTAFQHEEIGRDLGQRNLMRYAASLVAEVKMLDQRGVTQLSDEIGLSIIREDSRGTVKSLETLPDIASLESHLWPQKKRKRFRGEFMFPYPAGMYQEKIFVLIPFGTGRVAFMTKVPLTWESREWVLVLAIIALSLVVIGVFLAIRKLLAPVRDLRHGVQAVSRGDFGQVLEVAGHGELARLTSSFNIMSKEIANMISEKEQLLYDVSHELRTPLTRMKLALEMMPEAAYKNSIQDDVSEMEKMVSELLDAASLKAMGGKLATEKQDAKALLKAIVQKFDQDKPGITLEERDLYWNCHLEKTKTVIKNVIENALKYSAHQDQKVEVIMAEDCLIIRDYGVGIPSSEQTKIFEAFYRVDKSRQRGTGGYGLGLHLCKEIMEKQEGRIELESEEGQGTTITLHFAKRGH